MIYFGYTLQVVAFGAAVIGFVTGVLSVYFVNRRQSIMGDAIAHSSLAGIALGFLLVLKKSEPVLILGALVTALMAVGLIQMISRTEVKPDAAIGIVLSLFFGLGIVLLSYIQTIPIASQAGLKHYLFGNLTYLRFSELPLVLALALVVLGVIGLLWKELKLVTFDREFAKTLGMHVERYELVLLILVVVTIVVGVDLIGVVMTAGLLLAPAIAARQWAGTFGRVVFLSGILGAASGMTGTVLSANVSGLPPGPTIILVLGIVVGFSIIFSSRGLLQHYMTYVTFRLRFNVEESILHLADHMRLNPAKCDIREFDINPEHDEFPADLHTTTIEANHKLYDDIQVLIQLGYVSPREGGTWILTYKGMQAVSEINTEAMT